MSGITAKEIRAMLAGARSKLKEKGSLDGYFELEEWAANIASFALEQAAKVDKLEKALQQITGATSTTTAIQAATQKEDTQ